MESLQKIMECIQSERKQISSNSKDEIKVMKAMLNDPSYKVDIWTKNGVEEKPYCPYEEARNMITNIIKNTTKISTDEAQDLANNYDFGNQEASIMVGLSKEFVNTYIETGRKLPFGGRENSNISIAKKVRPETEKLISKKIGVDDDGTDKYEQVSIKIPEHTTFKVYSSAPSWKK